MSEFERIDDGYFRSFCKKIYLQLIKQTDFADIFPECPNLNKIYIVFLRL